MSDLVYMVFCESCQTLETLTAITDEWLDGKPMNGHYACARCGKFCGFWYDAGTLNLDEVRAAVPTDSTPFEIWI